MGIGVVTNESTIALVEELTEGTYVAPSTGADYVEVLSEGLELNKGREELTRDVLGGSVESEASRVGISDVTGSIPTEYKASKTAGNAPQSLDVLMKSLLGGKRQGSALISGSGHTSTVIQMPDTTGINKHDMVLVKESGAYEVRPVKEVITDTSIELGFALDNGAPSDLVEIEAFTTYYHDTSNSVTFSAEHNLGSQAIKQKARGLRAVSGAIENWTVGQLPTMNFSVQGLDIDRVDEDATASPDFSADGLPPVTLSACVWLSGQSMSYTELTLNIENTVSYIQDACDEDGRIGSRITEQVVTASFNPYLLDDSTAQTWDKFNSNEDVSLFGYAYNPSSVAGEFGEVVCFYIPQGKITEAPVSDVDGIVAESISIKAHKNQGNDSIFLGFI